MAKKIYGAPIFFEEEPGSDVIDLEKSEETYGEDSIYSFASDLDPADIDFLKALGYFELSIADTNHDYIITAEEYRKYREEQG